MAKYKLFVDETRSFRHEIEIETDLTEIQLDEKLSEIEGKNELCSLSNVRCELAKAGVCHTSMTKRDGTGVLGEFKIEEMEEIE